MPTTHPTILLIGIGHLGGVLLEFLARDEGLGKIIACGRNRARGEARCNVARLGALAQGLSAQIEFCQVDITDRERFAETLETRAPDLVISTATMQTWWLPELLPDRARARLQRARFGTWLPLHLAPTLSLMEAIRSSSFSGPVLTAPFPDVVNCVLGKIDLAPTCGIGNVDEIVAKVRATAARYLETPTASVQALMVAHHALESAAFGGHKEAAPPYFLRIYQDGTDVTGSVDTEEILFSPYPLSGGPTIAFFTCSSALRLVRTLLGETETLLHAPAPGGLPGGYPVHVSQLQVTPATIPGLDLAAAIDINERSHAFDGIESIEADGTAVFVPEGVQIMRDELGYDCPQLAPADAHERGAELVARFKEYAARHGVDLEQLA